ncbi:hypothetical protein C8R45DRAFT_923255 [Mycena sanguinolenta]|nr:hypothetical protein C8R45DRAFT_923255 [Mycena sanguinolenta]
MTFSPPSSPAVSLGSFALSVQFHSESFPVFLPLGSHYGYAPTMHAETSDIISRSSRQLVNVELLGVLRARKREADHHASSASQSADTICAFRVQHGSTRGYPKGNPYPYPSIPYPTNPRAQTRTGYPRVAALPAVPQTRRVKSRYPTAKKHEDKSHLCLWLNRKNGCSRTHSNTLVSFWWLKTRGFTRAGTRYCDGLKNLNPYPYPADPRVQTRKFNDGRVAATAAQSLRHSMDP